MLQILESLAHKNILILGFAREGVSTLKFLRKIFPKKVIGIADVLPESQLSSAARELLAQEQHFVNTYFGSTYLSQLSDYDVIFKASGIPPSMPELQQSQKQDARVLSNVSLFFDLCPGTIIGVTGTKGKSTTSALIASVLSRGQSDVRLAGNIGIPPLESLQGATRKTLFVLELSSFYLAGLEKSPHVAVVQNIVSEHGDYHGSFQAYIKAKSKIVRYQTTQDIVIFNADFSLPLQIALQSSAQKFSFSFTSSQAHCFVEDEFFVWNHNGKKERIFPCRTMSLLGKFNRYNVMPAIVLGKLFGVTNHDIADAVSHFQPLKHRLNFVADIQEIDFYDDSLSTVPEAAIAALETFAGRDIVLLAGGFDRGQDYTQLAEKIMELHVKALVLFPTTGERLWECVQRIGSGLQKSLPAHVFVSNMQETVTQAIVFAERGDVVLLSPAAPSFGMFRNYTDRGMQFQEAVKILKKV